MTTQPQFIYLICQNGAEAVCKAEVTANHPELRLAFSRPGFLTFKCDGDSLPERFHLKSTFARSYGWSVGNSKSDDLAGHLESFRQYEQLPTSNHLHVWQRDTRLPGQSGFEPGGNPLTEQIGSELAAAFEKQFNKKLPVNKHAKADEQVFDVVVIEPNHWFAGYHFAATTFQRWPGGAPNLDTDTPVVNRAYFKLNEALLWSGIHIQPNDCCAEIGSSPGGACQLLLEKGARVIAVDPAEMEPAILEHENLTHLRCRGKEVRKKELKDVRWLLSDLNATPVYTLDTIEEIVNNQHVNHIRGLILTLKLTDWELANQIPEWIERIKKLGFQLVKTRQLAFNRREICLFAVRDRFALRSSRKR